MSKKNNIKRCAKVNAKIYDNFPDKSKQSINLSIDISDIGLVVKAEGYGDAHSSEGNGYPIMLEVYEGDLRLLVWSDINNEDPTHIISLNGARESLRREIA